MRTGMENYVGKRRVCTRLKDACYRVELNGRIARLYNRSAAARWQATVTVAFAIAETELNACRKRI